MFVHLSKLETLVLDGNPIKTIDAETAAALGSLPALRRLSLAECNLKRLPDNLLVTFANLETLSLRNNFFVEIHEDLQHANKLRELDVGGNAFRVRSILTTLFFLLKHIFLNNIFLLQA